MGGQVIEDGFQAAVFQVDVPADIVVGVAVAGLILEHLGAVQELDPQVLAHGEQGHVEVVDLALLHVGVVGVVPGHRRDGVDDDVGVGVSRLDGLDKGGVVADEGLHVHVVVVGAEHDDHPAGLHHGHRLGDGVAAVVALKGDDLVVEGGLDAGALLGAELLEADQAVVVVPHGVGVTQKEGVGQIGLAGVLGLGQDGPRSLVDLVVVGQVALVDGDHRAGRGRGPPFAADQRPGDAGRDQDGQRADAADQGGLLLGGRHGRIVGLSVSIHDCSLPHFAAGAPSRRSAS